MNIPAIGGTTNVMSSNDIMHHMAQDFSMSWRDVLDLEDAPADEFFDPIATVFGDDLSAESILTIYRSKTELRNWPVS